jgi:hypothetical protein
MVRMEITLTFTETPDYGGDRCRSRLVRFCTESMSAQALVMYCTDQVPLHHNRPAALYAVRIEE